ncbi:MAG: YggS family pyridoxal phosphate-dependent enzyme [Bacillota bacterium]
MQLLAENYKRVIEQIRQAALSSGFDPGSVRLIAVTKMATLEQVREAASLGITEFGANRVQDAAEKVKSLPEVRWHFIGHLQTNKVKDVLPAYSLIQTLDRSSLARKLQQVAERFNCVAETLIQVNVSGEESKFGLAPGELPAFIDELAAYDRVKVRGLMTMAPYVDDAEEVRPYFKRLRQLRDENARGDLELKELSMGMTNDFKVAIEEGATMVRIGSALFDNMESR